MGRDLLSRNTGNEAPKDCQAATLNLSALDGKLGREEDQAVPENTSGKNKQNLKHYDGIFSKNTFFIKSKKDTKSRQLVEPIFVYTLAN